jgi:hypothetical protein
VIRANGVTVIWRRIDHAVVLADQIVRLADRLIRRVKGVCA